MCIPSLLHPTVEVKKPIFRTMGGSERGETEILAVWTQKTAFFDAPLHFMMRNRRINEFSALKIGGGCVPKLPYRTQKVEKPIVGTVEGGGGMNGFSADLDLEKRIF